jgi:ABC-type anion transport system duplicated permease subunit
MNICPSATPRLISGTRLSRGHAYNVLVFVEAVSKRNYTHKRHHQLRYRECLVTTDTNVDKWSSIEHPRTGYS